MINYSIVFQEKKRKEKLRRLKDKCNDKTPDLAESELSEPDISWLPDPDKPKKFDASWNEIAASSDSLEVLFICVSI